MRPNSDERIVVSIAAYLHFAKVRRIEDEIINLERFHVLVRRDLNVGVFDGDLVSVYLG